jgi:clan AA aspartic protease (TIGR02281 family)
MPRLRILSAIIGLLAAGCAPVPVPPEQAERERLFQSAIEPCKRQYPSIREVEIDRNGTIWAQARPESLEWSGFKRCAQEALARAAEKRPFGAGRLAASAGLANVPFKPSGALMLVPVTINGASATMLLDTGASVTIIRPAMAQRAGIEVPLHAPRTTVRVAGGERFSVPFVRAKSLRIGDAAVEGIDVCVFEGLVRQFPATVDGILGTNFLNHFRMTIDRQGRLLMLEPLPAASAQ